jgi:hypothetical protein
MRDSAYGYCDCDSGRSAAPHPDVLPIGQGLTGDVCVGGGDQSRRYFKPRPALPPAPVGPLALDVLLGHVLATRAASAAKCRLLRSTDGSTVPKVGGAGSCNRSASRACRRVRVDRRNGRRNALSHRIASQSLCARSASPIVPTYSPSTCPGFLNRVLI